MFDIQNLSENILQYIAKMLPSYQRLDSPKPLIQVSVAKFAVTVVSLPLFSFIFCVVWSLLFYAEDSTWTHCDVDNYLPSISAAIGNYPLQRFIWQLAISLHFIPRLLVTRMYLQYYDEHLRANLKPAANFACCLNFIENCALLTLSLWTSADSFEIHKFSFGIFIFTSELYMLISYLLNKNAKKLRTLSNTELISVRYKRNLFIINITSFWIGIYFYLRHNWYCESGVYTLFAFFEYIVVLTNMAYHMTGYWDFYGTSLAFDWYRGVYYFRN